MQGVGRVDGTEGVGGERESCDGGAGGVEACARESCDGGAGGVEACERDGGDAAVRTGAVEGASTAFFAGGGEVAGGVCSRGGLTAGGGVGAEAGGVDLRAGSSGGVV